MGEANRRGTKEQRVSQALARDSKLRTQRMEEAEDKWNALSSEEKEAIMLKEKRSNEALVGVYGITLALAPYLSIAKDIYGTSGRKRNKKWQK